MPEPIQNAMVAALEDDAATEKQIAIYRNRHQILRKGLELAGYEIEHSDGSLYVWVRAKSGSCWQDMEMLAKCGILVAPGEFYDADATGYLRFSVTVPTEQITELVERLKL
jgi:aspartate/methionine/tyrosine aminotransferase